MESDNVLWNQEELLVSGSVPLDLGYTNTLFLSLLNAWMLVTLWWSGGCTGMVHSAKGAEFSCFP